MSDDQFIIEPFEKRAEGYAELAHIWNTVFPLYPDTAEELAKSDEIRAGYFKYTACMRHRESGEMVGFGIVLVDMDTDDPNKLSIEIVVLPAWEGHGIGSALYTHLREHVADRNPTAFESFTISDQNRAMRFLADRGFEVATREYSSILDLNQFDPAPLAENVARARAGGIDFLNFHQIAERFPDDWQRRLYELLREVDEDIPWHADSKFYPFEIFLRRLENSLSRIPETYIIAVDGDQMVGQSGIYKTDASQELLFTGVTGVLRTHRRRGLALAMKTIALTYAKENLPAPDGRARKILTENEENNPMFTINERLGFVRAADILYYVKKLDRP